MAGILTLIICLDIFIIYHLFTKMDAFVLMTNYKSIKEMKPVLPNPKLTGNNDEQLKLDFTRALEDQKKYYNKAL